MNKLPLGSINKFEDNSIFFTDRIWNTLIEAVLDSLFFTIGKYNEIKSLSMQLLSTKLRYYKFTQLQGFISYIENMLENSLSRDSSKLSDIMKGESYSKEIQEFQSEFLSIERVSKEFNVKIKIFKSFEDSKQICYRQFYSALNLFIFEHSPNEFEVLSNDELSEVFEESLKPNLIEQLGLEIHKLLKNKLLIDSIDKEVLEEKINFINSRYMMGFDTNYMDSSENPDSTSQSIVVENSPNLPKLIKFNTQLCLKRDLKILN